MTKRKQPEVDDDEAKCVPPYVNKLSPNIREIYKDAHTSFFEKYSQQLYLIASTNNDSAVIKRTIDTFNSELYKSFYNTNIHTNVHTNVLWQQNQGFLSVFENTLCGFFEILNVWYICRVCKNWRNAMRKAVFLNQVKTYTHTVRAFCKFCWKPRCKIHKETLLPSNFLHYDCFLLSRQEQIPLSQRYWIFSGSVEELKPIGTNANSKPLGLHYTEIGSRWPSHITDYKRSYLFQERVDWFTQINHDLRVLYISSSNWRDLLHYIHLWPSLETLIINQRPNKEVSFYFPEKTRRQTAILKRQAFPCLKNIYIRIPRLTKAFVDVLTLEFKPEEQPTVKFIQTHSAYCDPYLIYTLAYNVRTQRDVRKVKKVLKNLEAESGIKTPEDKELRLTKIERKQKSNVIDLI